jgi:replication fork clamp-binding protein CrfC
MYSNDEPKRGSVAPGSLPKPAEALKTSRSLYFGQRVIQDPSKYDSKTKVIELRNVDVELPQDGESLHWCKMFKLTDISKKHHLIHVSIKMIIKFSINEFIERQKYVACPSVGWIFTIRRLNVK